MPKIHITPADQTRSPYFYIPVEVSPGTTRIDVTLAYPKANDAVIDLGMLDPRATDYPSEYGFRGWSGGARDTFFVATDDATPGYIHGEIQPGTWKIILGLYKVPAAGLDVTVNTSFDAMPRALTPQPERTFPVRAGAGWYKGDLHCHTFHSDARGAPEILHAAAKQAGLDFLAIADHNTITQRRYFCPNSSPDLVFVRAMEITTATGHANVYGVDEWIDFRMSQPSDAHTLARLVHEKGGLLSINHDKPTIQWDYELPEIDCQEVWQSHWLAWNWVALARYQQRLASGLRISLIGGSDFHQPAELQPEGPFVLARPTTFLWLHELSEDAVLAAMKAGRGYVTESPTGPHLSITANGQSMGSVLPAGPVEASAMVKGGEGDRLVWLDATGPIHEQLVDSAEWHGTFSGTPKTFLRAELIAEAGRQSIVDAFVTGLEGKTLPWQLQGADLTNQLIRRALSNPIYIEP